jgi:hypothetical protein
LAATKTSSWRKPFSRPALRPQTASPTRWRWWVIFPLGRQIGIHRLPDDFSQKAPLFRGETRYLSKGMNKAMKIHGLSRLVNPNDDL